MNQKERSQHKITLVFKAPMQMQKKPEVHEPKEEDKNPLDDILKTVYGALRKLFEIKGKKPVKAPPIGIRG